MVYKIGQNYCKDNEGNLYTIELDCSGFMDLEGCDAKRIEIRSYLE